MRRLVIIIFVAGLIFIFPPPGIFVDTVTRPCKQFISAILVELLAGVRRTESIFSLGPYQMLVADGCSGLDSILRLSALGMLFMYTKRRKSLLHNAIMLASTLPIAFAATVVRGILLVLITYHFGDEAGQGFLRGIDGAVQILVALMLLLALDALLVRVLRPRGPSPPMPTPVNAGS